MNTKISLKKTWVSTSGWRGYQQPIFACAGANDTGGWEDSPCPSSVCEKELNEFCSKLRKAGIKYKKTWGQTSNVFCIARYVAVSEADHAKAHEIAEQHEKETRLFYKCEILKEKEIIHQP